MDEKLIDALNNISGVLVNINETLEIISESLDSIDTTLDKHRDDFCVGVEDVCTILDR